MGVGNQAGWGGMGVSDAVGGVGYPGVEPEAYISGGRPAACVLS